MTEESVLLVRELKGKIHRLFGEYTKLEKRNEELHNEINSLKGRIRVLESENALLVTKYDHLRQARGLEAGLGDSKLARQKVNKLLREIDKCVALLNG
jgi:predicted nuclease with TOPRIM domain